MNALIIVNDLTPRDLVQLAKKSAGEFEHVDLLYVKPMLPSCYHLLPSMADIEAQTAQDAVDALRFIGNMLGVKQPHQWCTTGLIKSQARYLAGELGADVVLVTESIYGQFHIKQLHLKHHLTCAIRLIQDVVVNVATPKDPFTLVGHAMA